MAAVRFCLDYPGINCRQCRDNLRDDGIEPECEKVHPPAPSFFQGGGRGVVEGVGGGCAGTVCPVSSWDSDTRLAMALYERSCPWGELDYMTVKDAFNDLEIPHHKRRLMRRVLPAIHREIKQAAQRQAAQV